MLEYDASPFVEVRAEFMAGLGDPDRLLAGLRESTFLMPLDVNERFFTLPSGGLLWMVAFTSELPLRLFLRSADREEEEVLVTVVPGAAIVDNLLDRAPVPTGLMIDAGSDEPFAFPPTKQLTPHCYVDVDADDGAGRIVIDPAVPRLGG